jgi:ADP-L-glycero-D-manno-heptose 6-epimerase
MNTFVDPLPRGKILVTGGAGFIGSAIVWALNRRGYENIIIADFLGKDEKWKNLVPLRFADYLEADTLAEILRGKPGHFGKTGAVFHLGACSATTERDAAYLIRNNFEYTKDLARWSLTSGARFIYASSAATYGDGERGMTDDESGIHLLRPLNMYGYSKHLFDLYARREGILDRIVGLKYFNVFGPNENHKDDMRSLVNKAYAQIVSTGSVELFRSHRPDYRDGEQKRDFLYVKDAVEMTLHFAENTAAGGLYNIGSESANTWNTLANAIFKALGKNPQIRYVDMPESIRGKYQYFTQADTSKLRSTGYTRSPYPLEDAVADYVLNYLAPGCHLGDEGPR